ncbi:MAG: DNA repair protein RecO [Verrucomicrobia bacterium]|nr:MAG: DNA repair protein RecO [Verrucomicrobiota bacterium]TAE87482.1 MAG: DNA repair protein RecO [Verrucomicrobiota bacterium]TAF25764.1 MAG: DNA repair protein RecO [Verrucomicrobiota bacterium]TAF41552.1 MAG: DNA repair protein RecO [Verrucomicrobiota bacterium]
MEHCHGTLIRLTKLTDTSWIVHWFTLEHGLIKTVAKGARNPKSPFAGKLDLFFDAEIAWSPARSGDLHGLREVAVTDTRESIRGDYHSMLLAGYWCRLLELTVERDHPEPELGRLLRRALDHVATRGASIRALQHFEQELATNLGIARDRDQAALALREALGGLPPQRAQLLERLSSTRDFPIAGSKPHDLS